MRSDGEATPEDITWRSLLGDIIQVPQEKQRIITATGVSTITLMRWVKGLADPRSAALSRLLAALPEQRAQLQQLIQKEFPTFAITTSEAAGEVEPEIPSALYAKVLHELIYLASPKLHWSLRQRILQQALEQLDPGQIHLSLMLVLCTPPAPNAVVRSQREVMGAGTPPWGGAFGIHSILLGAEVTAGEALATGRPIVVQGGNQSGIRTPHLPKSWFGGISSIPLLRDHRVAGTLIAFSSQTGAFFPARQALLEQYGALLNLTLSDDIFYPLEQIRLLVMPSASIQGQYLAQFRARVKRLLLEAQINQHMLTVLQAEQIIWQQLEDELAQAAYTSQQTGESQ